MATMTKTQIVRTLAEQTGTNNKTAAAFLENLANTAIKETKKNGVFVIPGLGRLVKQNRKARMGRNPQTGEAIKIPQRPSANSASPKPQRMRSRRRNNSSFELTSQRPTATGWPFGFSTQQSAVITQPENRDIGSSVRRVI